MTRKLVRLVPAALGTLLIVLFIFLSNANGQGKVKKQKGPCRSFDMREKRLFDQLDNVELEAIGTISRMLKK